MTRLAAAIVRRTDQHGFSIVELLVAIAITLAVTASVFAVLDPINGAFQRQPELADVEQRARGVVDLLQRDLLVAGAGAPHRALPGQPPGMVPALLPHRVGLRNADPAGTFQPGTVTILSIEPGAAQSTLTAPLPATSASTQVALDGACPEGDPSCGFRVGMTVTAADATGSWDLYSVLSVAGAQLSLRHNSRDSAKVYEVGSIIASVSSRTFMLRDEAGTGTPQLVQYEGANGFDVPIASHVVALEFAYLGEAEPPALIGGVPGMGELRATYGLLPPALDAQPTLYPPGENCTFMRDSGGGVTSRLASLGAGPFLVPLAEDVLTDGPWCPDEGSPNRYDADLLRIRRIVVTVRVQAAVASLRGPAGRLFARGGTARGARLVPDREVRFSVAPRVLNMVR